ncbi:hypothetical protein Pfo_003551 [Paulownia fortunei]|nr:hypothetical protein Pfo_003551 [Paulownia fortunei]
MLFYLTTMNLARFLIEDADFLCRNFMLNGLDNTLYNVYCSVKTVKELWNSLDKKYKMEDTGIKKFIVGKFLDFKIVDIKTIISQVQEMQIILHDILVEGMMPSESFQVAALIEKMPLLWKDFKNYLKHKHKEMTIEDMIVHLRIEGDNRVVEKKISANRMEAKSQHDKGAKRFKGNCYNYGKPNHKAKNFRLWKKGNQNQAKVTEDKIVPVDMSDLMLLVVVFDANLMDNLREWWVDTRATRHICLDKEMFSTYILINGKKLFLGN